MWDRGTVLALLSILFKQNDGLKKNAGNYQPLFTLLVEMN